MNKRLTLVLIDILQFMAIAIWFLFLYYVLWSFVLNAIRLDYVNFQTAGYTAYAFLLQIFTVMIAWKTKFDKAILFRLVTWLLALSILVCTTADIIKYNAFIGYNINYAHAIFVKLVEEMPNMVGVVVCIILSILYFLFGLYAPKSMSKGLLLYFLIFFFDGILPIIYSYITTNAYPRKVWLKRAAFILPQQFFILVSFIISSLDKELWIRNFR